VSPSVVGISNTLNDEEDYFRLGFTFISCSNTYLRVDYNIDLRASFLKTRLLPDAGSSLLFLSTPPPPFFVTNLTPFSYCPLSLLPYRRAKLEGQRVLPQAEVGNTHKCLPSQTWRGRDARLGLELNIRLQKLCDGSCFFSSSSSLNIMRYGSKTCSICRTILMLLYIEGPE
jgi:hypothetical protein